CARRAEGYYSNTAGYFDYW
nr:immunoglobulin heavy chain junction region [Mus musculus]MBK4188051.1 immunoglobulin heavy chain junction region [Mus musculus]